jgi:hypothetical protein
MRCVFFSCCLIVASIAPAARAEVKYERTKQGDHDFDVIRMTVTPAAEPVPALRYRLLTREIDLKAGNAVPYYYRAMLDLPAFMKQLREKFDEDKDLGPWYDIGADAQPIAELPLAKVREANQMFDSIYNRQLRYAFERSDCDWELGTRELRGIETVEFLLPEFQSARELARMMALRTRLALAEDRYDDAIELMRQQYRLGHDVAKESFLVCGLIGIAIDGIANSTITDLIGCPNSPNMYWALTELPQPAIDLQPAVRYEMEFGSRMFPLIDHPGTADHAPQEWNRLYRQTVGDFSKIGGNVYGGNNGRALQDKVEVGVAATGLALLGYSHAKEQLIAQGMAREQVEKMAVGQVIAIYTARMNARYGDDFEKMGYAPFPEMSKKLKEQDLQLAKMGPLGPAAEREVIPMMSLLLPGIQNCRNAQVRAERQVAGLRVIEAIRIYAADHGDTLPKTLDEIDEVPVPTNPATAKPFVYHLDGKTAVLELPVSDQMIAGDCRYEIQLAAKK